MLSSLRKTKYCCFMRILFFVVICFSSFINIQLAAEEDTSVRKSYQFLKNAFSHPSKNAKPSTYWHHMNGNITREGITADLEAMKNIGLSGVLFMNVGSFLKIPENLVEYQGYMTPDWQEKFRFILEEAARLDMEVGSTVCDGWGNAGGPDITPDNSMQKLTWSEIQVQSGDSINLQQLNAPPSFLNYYKDGINKLKVQ